MHNMFKCVVPSLNKSVRTLPIPHQFSASTRSCRVPASQARWVPQSSARANHTLHQHAASPVHVPPVPTVSSISYPRDSHTIHGDFDEVPTLDISGLFSADIAERQRTANQLGAVAERVGFAYIAGHGIDPALIEGLQSATREFYALDELKRMTTFIGQSFPGHKGYQPSTEFQ